MLLQLKAKALKASEMGVIGYTTTRCEISSCNLDKQRGDYL